MMVPNACSKQCLFGVFDSDVVNRHVMSNHCQGVGKGSCGVDRQSNDNRVCVCVLSIDKQLYNNCDSSNLEHRMLV